MKLSRTAWFILGAGIFIIAVGVLFALYRGEMGEQEEVNGKLAVVQNTLPKLVSQRQGLESQLAQLEGELSQVTSSIASFEAAFPESVESIEYDEVLFELADNHALEIQKLEASEPGESQEDDESVVFMVTGFDVEVMGEVADILDYINTVVNNEFFTTADVELVDITIPFPMTEEQIDELRNELTEEGLTPDEIDAEIQKSEWASAKIKITIYSYEGE